MLPMISIMKLLHLGNGISPNFPPECVDLESSQNIRHQTIKESPQSFISTNQAPRLCPRVPSCDAMWIHSRIQIPFPIWECTTTTISTNKLCRGIPLGVHFRGKQLIQILPNLKNPTYLNSLAYISTWNKT